MPNGWSLNWERMAARKGKAPRDTLCRKLACLCCVCPCCVWRMPKESSLALMTNWPHHTRLSALLHLRSSDMLIIRRAVARVGAARAPQGANDYRGGCSAGERPNQFNFVISAHRGRWQQEALRVNLSSLIYALTVLGPILGGLITQNTSLRWYTYCPSGLRL
jgi:hypothetical protein